MNEVLTNATHLAQQLQADIAQAANRVDHIRMTARANEAWKIVELLQKLLTNVD
jgi:hypothetical protein